MRNYKAKPKKKFFHKKIKHLKKPLNKKILKRDKKYKGFYRQFHETWKYGKSHEKDSWIIKDWYYLDRYFGGF